MPTNDPYILIISCPLSSQKDSAYDIMGNRYTVKKNSKNWLANFPMMQIEPLILNFLVGSHKFAVFGQKVVAQILRFGQKSA